MRKAILTGLILLWVSGTAGSNFLSGSVVQWNYTFLHYVLASYVKS